jgi:hypothetical protein
MVYLKSLVAGTFALALAVALSPILIGIYFYVVYRPGADVTTAWDPTSCAKQPVIWAISGLVFVAGFVCEFWRAHRRHRL